MHRLVFLCLLASAFLLYACSDPNSDAPAGGIHALDGSYLDGSEHGPDAKQNLTFCQGCHGEAGGPGDNPNFNVGIDTVTGTGCESAGCHEVDYAHPEDWAGPNSTFHYSAGNVQDACALCHGAALDGAGGVGPSCLDCHDSTSAFTLNCAACHDYPPDGTIHSGTISGVDHSALTTTLAWTAHSECTICHGMSESASGGGFDADANYTFFNYSTDIIGDHWDGNIQMNDDLGYSETNYGCDSAGCHLNDPDHRLSDSGLTVDLKSFGSVSAPHPLDGTYLSGGLHGPDAKQDLTVCQACHGEAGGSGSNPNFNVGIFSAGGTGCESAGCHEVDYAHPDEWAGPNSTFHYSAGNVQDACSLCHGTGLDGDGGAAAGPSCLSCHDEVTTFTLDCTACHGYPPDGTLHAGTITGVDHKEAVDKSAHEVCTICHGMRESAAGGGFEPVTNYTLFDTATDTIGDHWDGNIHMSNVRQYNEVSQGCDNAGCHNGTDSEFQLPPGSGLPVVLGDF